MPSNIQRLFHALADEPKAEYDKVAEKPKPPTGEAGVSGTTIYSGQIFSEENVKLQWEKAYGYPGVMEWGEWERLERTDHMVASALNMLAAPIRDSEIAIEYAEEVEVDGAEAKQEELAELDEEDAHEDAIVSFVKDCFGEWIEPGWAQLLEQIVHYGLGYGFSLHEIVWNVRQDDRVPGGTAVYPCKLAQRLPSSVKANGWVVENGELQAVMQSGTKDGKWVDGIRLPADKCLLATWNRSGQNYQGVSAFRAGWYLGKIRAELLKIVAIGHSRESLGIPVIESEKDVSLSDAQREKLQTVIENIIYQENAAIQLPAGVKLNWIFSSGADKSHVMDTWNRLGVALLELVQVQQLALGTGETGSRSVGEVHDATKNAFVSGIRAWIESVFNGVGAQPYTGLVRKIIDLNFGPQKRYPKFKLVPKADEDTSDGPGQKLWVDAVAAAANAKAVHLMPKDEEFVRRRLGLPAVSEAEIVAEKEVRDQKALEIAGAMPPKPPFMAPK